MNEYYEVAVDFVVGMLRNGKNKIKRETYLVNAQSVTEAEARLVENFTKTNPIIEYFVVGAKKSQVVAIIE
jgi:hypothetical protein